MKFKYLAGAAAIAASLSTTVPGQNVRCPSGWHASSYGQGHAGNRLELQVDLASERYTLHIANGEPGMQAALLIGTQRASTAFGDERRVLVRALFTLGTFELDAAGMLEAEIDLPDLGGATDMSFMVQAVAWRAEDLSIELSHGLELAWNCGGSDDDGSRGDRTYPTADLRYGGEFTAEPVPPVGIDGGDDGSRPRVQQPRDRRYGGEFTAEPVPPVGIDGDDDGSRPRVQQPRDLRYNGGDDGSHPRVQQPRDLRTGGGLTAEPVPPVGIHDGDDGSRPRTRKPIN